MLTTIKKNEYIQRFSSSKYKSIIILTAKIIIASGLITYLIFKIDSDKILAAFYEANSVIILSVLLLAILNIYLQYWKWELVCRKILGVKEKKKIFRSLFYGFSAGAFTPIRIGEYFGRAIALKDNSLLQVTIATIIDKIFPLVIVLFAGSLASILFVFYYYEVTIYITVSLFIVVFILFYFFFYLLLSESFWQNIIIANLSKIKIFAKIFKQHNTLQQLTGNTVASLTFISILFYACFILQYALLVIAFAHEFHLLKFIWAGTLMMFAKTVIPPISFGELGIREGASIFFLMTFGFSEAVGFNASIFLYLINVLLPALAGLLLLPRKING